LLETGGDPPDGFRLPVKACRLQPGLSPSDYLLRFKDIASNHERRQGKSCNLPKNGARFTSLLSNGRFASFSIATGEFFSRKKSVTQKKKFLLRQRTCFPGGISRALLVNLARTIQLQMEKFFRRTGRLKFQSGN
jgi:hypothetical protein